MECIVNGYPDPDLLWFKGVYDPQLNNIPLYDSAKYELEKTRSYGAVGTNVSAHFREWSFPCEQFAHFFKKDDSYYTRWNYG